MVLTGDGRAELICAACGTFWRLLRRRGDPTPAIDLEDHYATSPPAGAWYVAYAKGADGICRPICLADSLSGVWDGAMTSNLHGAIIISATDPPRRREAS
jgi:hypothetical protein